MPKVDAELLQIICSPILCCSLDHETPEEAWGEFNSKLQKLLSNPHKYYYWRLEPELESDRVYPEDRIIYQVVSRILATDTPLNAIPPIILGDYPDRNDNHWANFVAQSLELWGNAKHG